MESKMYVVHTCKNSKLKPTDENYCNNCFIDVDKTNCTTHPPTWKYCPECEKKGFKNPKTRQVTKTPEQIEAFKQRMAEYRAKNAG
mgnify:CR=1 FL=1